VFLVRPDELDSDDPRWTDPISQLAERIARWSGNSASFIEATPTQMRAMLDRDEPIIADIRTDAIPLTERALLDISAVTR
jgi:hypothetical protein